MKEIKNTVGALSLESLPPSDVKVYKNETTGRISAMVSLVNAEQRELLVTTIERSLFSFVFPKPFGQARRASFAADLGPCPSGSVSQTGDLETTCRTCRSGTYVSL